MKTEKSNHRWSSYTHLVLATILGLGINKIYPYQEVIILTFFLYPLTLLLYRKLKWVKI